MVAAEPQVLPPRPTTSSSAQPTAELPMTVWV